MLKSLAWSELKFYWWAAVVTGVIAFWTEQYFGRGPANASLFSEYGATRAGLFILFLLAGFVVLGFLVGDLPLIIAHRIVTEGPLPDPFVPKMECRSEPWWKCTHVRYLNWLKTELVAAEQRVLELKRVEAYCDHYERLRSQVAVDPIALWALRKARKCLQEHCRLDREFIPQLVERIERVYAGEVGGDVRGLEERIEALQREKKTTPAEWSGTLGKIDAQIRACERDIAELREWRALRAAVKDAPLQQAFDYAQTVEYNNETIEVISRHAKFKARERELDLKKEERRRIRERVERGELTVDEGEYLLRELDEDFNQDKDGVFK